MESLKLQFVKGVFYTALAKYIGIVIQLIVTAILARLLSPDEFGVVAICTVVIAFFHQFTNMGIGVAIIQRQDLKEHDYNQLYSFSIYFGLFLMIIFCCFSFSISSWYDRSDLIIYLQLLSLQLLFSTWNMVPSALMAKAKKFKFLATRQLVIQITMGTIACLVAFYGYGIYSLLITPIFSALFSYVITIRYTHLRFSFSFSFVPLKKIFSYSFFQFAFGFINYFSRNLDKILTGKYLSMAELGFYEKSYRLVLLPMQNITGVVNPVVQPILAKYQNDKDKLGNYLLRILRIINMICFPLSVCAFFCSKEIIILFFGNQWYDAIPCFQILSLSIGFQAANHITGVFFQVANSTKIMFWIGLINSLENMLGFIIAISVWHTIEAVACGVSIVFTLCFFQTYFVLFSYVIKGFYPSFIKNLYVPFLGSVLVATALLGVENIGLENLWSSVAVKVIIYLLITLFFYHFSGFVRLSTFLDKLKSLRK